MMRITTLVVAALASFFLAACGTEATDIVAGLSPVTEKNVLDMNDMAQMTKVHDGLIKQCSPLDRTKYTDQMYCEGDYYESLGTMKVTGYVHRLQPKQLIVGHREFWVANDTTFPDGMLPVACPVSISACNTVQANQNISLLLKMQTVVQDPDGYKLVRPHLVVQSITVS